MIGRAIDFSGEKESYALYYRLVVQCSEIESAFYYHIYKGYRACMGLHFAPLAEFEYATQVREPYRRNWLL